MDCIYLHSNMILHVFHGKKTFIREQRSKNYTIRDILTFHITRKLFRDIIISSVAITTIITTVKLFFKRNKITMLTHLL